ncbi:NAD(P)-dependent oxidoreductase [Lacibacter sp. H375]|uniref:NAD-dependent epimerase/dehydratase family protein n=1 Tax=Lacibacter sp. H375 TaxID=3133424 RepID=UPI0030C17504
MGYKVLALARSKEPPVNLLQYAGYQSVDIAEAVPKLEAAVCIHCAGLASDKESHNNLIRVNTDGTKNVFSNIKAGHFIYISSASVYPPNGLLHKEDELIDENELSAYGYSKLKAEQWLQQQASDGSKITVIRPRAVYGAGDRILMPRILRLKKGPFLVTPAKLDYTISLTNIENLLLATKAIIQSEKEYEYEVYNVTDDPTHQFGEVIERIWEILATEKNISVKVPQPVLEFAAKLLPLSDLNANTLKYYLCHHQLLNEKVKSTFGIQLPHNFNNYIPVLEKWINSTPLADLQKGAADLPWRKETL